MLVICVDRTDGFSSETALAERDEAEVRWATLIDKACRCAEKKRLTVTLAMWDVEAPTEKAATSAIKAGMGKKVKTVRVLPPKRLDQKVTVGGPGAVTEAVLDEGQKAIDVHADAYPEKAHADLQAMQRIVDLLAAGTESKERQDALKAELYQLTYKVKGQAGTFGYPMVTAVAHHLYVMARALKIADSRICEAIQVHLDTIHLILNRRLTGATPEGREIVTRLHDVVVKMVGDPDQ